MMNGEYLDSTVLPRVGRDYHYDLFQHLSSLEHLLGSGLSPDERRAALTAQLERLQARLSDFFSQEETEFFAPLLDEHPRLSRMLHQLSGQRFACLARLQRLLLRLQQCADEAELYAVCEELTEVLSLFKAREVEKRDVLALAYLEDLGGSE